jgi:Arc/MetJ-type ribon-helix-helix transcriptional regulator
MSKNNMKIISMRITESDHMKIKRIARRLEANDSDVIRFAIKIILSKLSPLDRPDRYGRDVLPAFIEYGTELANFFAMDIEKIDNIINQDKGADTLTVDLHDIELIAMSTMQDHILQRRIQEIVTRKNSTKNHDNALREYLYEKYLCSNDVTEPISVASSE